MFVSRFRYFLPRNLPRRHKQEHKRPRAHLTYIRNHFRDESTQKVTQAPVELLLRDIFGPRPKSQFYISESPSFFDTNFTRDKIYLDFLTVMLS